MSIRRIYVEKREGSRIEAEALKKELQREIGRDRLTSVRRLIRYDCEGMSDEDFRMTANTIFSEPPLDVLHDSLPEEKEGEYRISVEYLPGQFDQRADSAMQSVMLITGKEQPLIRTAVSYIFEGKLSEKDKALIRSMLINPVDSRLASEEIPETLRLTLEEPQPIPAIEGFTGFSGEEIERLHASMSLAMTVKDLLFVQKYFRDEEKRDPVETEIRVLDTYWSDHCRHTTFLTHLKSVDVEGEDYKDTVLRSLGEYEEGRRKEEERGKKRERTLMDLALMAMRELKKEGKLSDQEETDEINACSVIVDIDGEEWLLQFKNETHNHPTEIEPFGGAATCLGGAIRDPLSGRAYVYQAMRITGAADPRKPRSETRAGKLPQKKIVQEAAHGYSSYGNQIGLATGYVEELYHPGYEAKRMEIGAVIAAVPRRAVRREQGEEGDRIILLGGRTGRDGIGGATGSSKSHTTSSLTTCGAEVQKGNPPTERKLQRLFRREEASRLIKKCNDFGAGGVAVAIGELAPGLRISLDSVPKKYAGLNGTELAISESQERMAVVLDPKDADEFLRLAAEENLEATPVAVVTKEERLVMEFRGQTVVNLSRAFLDTNGASSEAEALLVLPKKEESPFHENGAAFLQKADLSLAEGRSLKECLLEALSSLQGGSQQGLQERFDGSIGAASLWMPYGGKYQKSPVQGMASLLPGAEKKDFASAMTYGFDPYLSSWSPYHGSVYAVLQSLMKLVAMGFPYRKARLTFQEYFRRMKRKEDWGLPVLALLGAYEAEKRFSIPSIGGKDSMSGSFEDLHVPPTLVSFAVSTGKASLAKTPEMKKAGNSICLLTLPVTEEDLPDFEAAMKLLDRLEEDMREGRIVSAYVLGRGGIREGLCRMLFGNRLGADLREELTNTELAKPAYTSFLLEVSEGASLQEYGTALRVLGTVREGGVLRRGSEECKISLVEEASDKVLQDIFPIVSGQKIPKNPQPEMVRDFPHLQRTRAEASRVKVFLPVFPGTNCEYDSIRAFERAGASAKALVMRNQTVHEIEESIRAFEAELRNANILYFPGGFSAGDEPDGSAKFFAAMFRNPALKDAVHDLLYKRDGLALGICNGFQALIKLGLVPYGEIREQKKDSPTLSVNRIGRHISRPVCLRVLNTDSPWLRYASKEIVYVNPASHGEGRFTANREVLEELFRNGQVATLYADPDGNTGVEEPWNPNGSAGGVEGILSPDGRILGKMAHSERTGEGLLRNIEGQQRIGIFEAGVDYFTGGKK